MQVYHALVQSAELCRVMRRMRPLPADVTLLQMQPSAFLVPRTQRSCPTHPREMLHGVFHTESIQEIKDPTHPMQYLLPPVKVSNSQMFFMAHIFIPTSTKQKFLLWTRFHPI